MNDLKEKIESVFKGDKRLKFFVIAGIAAVLLLLASESYPANNDNSDKVNAFDYNEYCNSLTSQTEELISSINGVGRCRVMITFKDSSENFYAKNNEQNDSDSSNSRKSEYVLYDGQQGEEPVLLKQRLPEVCGVAVVCDGGDITVVRENVISAVSSLFNLPVTKISVSKYKG